MNDKLLDQGELEEIVAAFKKSSQLEQVDYEAFPLSDGPYVIFYVAHPSERFFLNLNDAVSEVSDDNSLKQRVTLKKRGSVSDRMELPEVGLLRKVISESLTATKSSVDNGGFRERYIETVDGAEQQISSKSNHIVYGRRGAGKSSLLLYGLNELEEKKRPYSWVAMQALSQIHGEQIFAYFLGSVVEGLKNCFGYEAEISYLEEYYDDLFLSEGDEFGKKLSYSLKKLRRLLGKISQENGGVYVFLDDFHVVRKEFQPKLLSYLYSVSRDNGVYIKISGVQTFSEIYDAKKKEGLQPTHDIQQINLDRHLTMPHKSFDHVKMILDKYSVFCGLPSISYICPKDALQRLVWVSAGVPRDALNIFLSASSKSMIKSQKSVTVTSINSSASEMADSKMKEMESDAVNGVEGIRGLLDKIRKFCIYEKSKNAFLVEINPERDEYKIIEELIELRFLHLLHEGITPSEAGRRYKALMLDYGFYVGIRTKRNFDFFQKVPDDLSAKTLRKLPVYNLEAS